MVPDEPERDLFDCRAGDSRTTPPRLVRLNDEQYRATVAVWLTSRITQDGPDVRKNPAYGGFFDPAFAGRSTSDRFSTNARSYSIEPIEFDEALSVSVDLVDAGMRRLFNKPCFGSADETKQTECFWTHFFSALPRLTSRPVDEPERALYRSLFDEGRKEGLSALAAAQEVIRLALMSPSFFFREEVGRREDGSAEPVRLTTFEVAEGIAYSLTPYPPDAPLWAATETDELQTVEGRKSHIRRLLETSPYSRALVASFLVEYLRLEDVVQTDKSNFKFTTGSGATMRITEKHLADVLSLDRRLLEELFSLREGNFLQTLLTTRAAYIQGYGASAFGMKEAASAERVPQKVMLPATRAGLLTHPAFLIGHSAADHNDPTRRGRFVRESLLCGEVPEVPIGVIPTLPEGEALTTRERWSAHVEPRCAACHDLMDPLGFAFEMYNHLGEDQDQEAGQPIDASGVVSQGGDADGPFVGAPQLMERLARSQTVAKCFLRHTFEFFVGRKPTFSADRCALAEAWSAWQASDGDLVETLSTLLASENFMLRGAP